MLNRICISLLILLPGILTSQENRLAFRIVKPDSTSQRADDSVDSSPRDTTITFLERLAFFDAMASDRRGLNSNVNYEIIDLSGEGLRTIPFEYVTHRWVSKYDLSNNNIKKVSRRFGKVSTDTLILASNSIKEFGPASFYSRLVYFDVSNNALEEIPSELVDCRRMRYADFSGNRIDRIPPMFFPLYLETLLIGSNELRDLPNRMRSLNYLRTLDLHNNSFEKVPRVIYEMDNLRYVDLSFNMIEKVSTRIAKLPYLQVLDLTGNPLAKEDVERLRAILPKGVEVRF